MTYLDVLKTVFLNLTRNKMFRACKVGTGLLAAISLIAIGA